MVAADETDRHGNWREIARRVLRTEANALGTMADDPPEGFGRAIDLILAVKGRVILAGMGKSGLIARKIAATLSSTGTPALFLHPSEASHGDLGMVTGDDICLLLSNSGETRELSDLIQYTRRFAIPMICITRGRQSTLTDNSDVTLLLPDAPEACSIGMAPTTSTTCALALGDALAVTLMEERGFAPDSFQVFHPGGKLGAQLMRIQQVMHGIERVCLVPETLPMTEVIPSMTAAGFGIVGVVDGGGDLVGVITDGDLRRNIIGLVDRTAVEICTVNPVTVTSDTLVVEALSTMNQNNIGALLVCNASKPIGIVHLHDLLRTGVMHNTENPRPALGGRTPG